MNFAFSEEQEELRRTVRQFLEAKSPETEVRRLMETTEGYDPAVWKQMGQELGAAVARDPRGVRRPGLHVHRARHRARGDGPGAAVRAVLLVGRARRERDPQRRHRGPRSRRCSPASRAATRSRRSRSPSRRASGTRPASRWRRARARAAASRCRGEKMFVIDGFTADLIVVVARLAGTTGTDGISFFTVAGDADGLTRTSLQTMDMTRKQAKLEFDNVEAPPLGSTEDGFAAFSQDARPGRGRALQRDDGRRAEGARDVGRVREGPRAVRPPDRFVPGDQAQVRRHAARGRVGQVRRVLRVVGRRRGQRRAARGRRAVEGVLLGGVLPRRPPRTSRSTAASASRGSTPRTCTSSGRSVRDLSSATRRTTASCSRSASASDRPH